MPDYLRPTIRSMAGYTPGEQPRDSRIVKLNTNENPYPPSPKVREAIAELLNGDRLRRYPDPTGATFRHAASAVLGIDPECILIGNGSDDILTIITRAFVPEGGLIASPTPSYLLYHTLAGIQGARFQAIPFSDDWSLPSPWPLTDAQLTFVANPNSPSGTIVSVDRLKKLASEIRGMLVIDEAYVDFAACDALELVRIPNVIITRTLSKSYSLAGLRFGFGLANPDLIQQLVKVKDSYNCDALSLAGATAALLDQEHMKANRARILATRAVLANGLRDRGFTVTPSHANFVWATRSDQPVKPIFERLKRCHVYVRYMDYGSLGDGLRVTVGTDAEISKLFEAFDN